MKNNAIKLLAIILTLGVWLFSFHEHDNVNTIETSIKNNLHIGDEKSVIVSFLNKTDWAYAYDEGKEYFAIASDKTSECIDRKFLLWLFYECSIHITTKTDESGNSLNYDVEQFFSEL